MARSPKRASAQQNPDAQTLFLPFPGTVGLLVSRRGRKAAEERREFGSASAALDWCLQERVNLVFYHGRMPALN